MISDLHPYGLCPQCGAYGVSRERRPNGNDKCANGHVYMSKTAVAFAQQVKADKAAPVFAPPDMKPLVIIESPYAGDVLRNVIYARACLHDSILRGEAPYASHLLYTQPNVLDDGVPGERELGMGCGWHVMLHADLVAAYVDLGWSSGMHRGVEAAHKAGKTVDLRRLRAVEGQWQADYEASRVHSRVWQVKKYAFPGFAISE